MPSAAAFIDLQVNGYAGVDFNSDDLTAEQVHAACRRLRDDGVAGILATLITDAVDRMAGRAATIASLRGQDALVAQMIRGIHLEGPFLNPTPGYVGAHPAEHVRPADVDTMQRLLDAADGLVRLVTLAPESDPGMTVTRLLADRGVLVSAGHCDASLEELRRGLDAGLSMFTHLGNGCPVALPRHDNIIQRVLSLRDRLTISFIADGVHIPYWTLANYLSFVGTERTVLVTDAISAAGLGPGRYTLGCRTVDVGKDLVARAPDGLHFVGSTATMPGMATALTRELALSGSQVAALTSHNPRRLLGADA